MQIEYTSTPFYEAEPRPHIQIKHIRHSFKIDTYARLTCLEVQHIKNGKKIGYIRLDSIRIDDTYKGEGISYLLYQEFGKLCREKFTNYSFESHFINPIAEYSFLKSIEQGYIPEFIMDKSSIQRSYFDEDVLLWKDLQKKLSKAQRVLSAV